MHNKKSILFISPNSPFDSIGGVERYITNLINYCKSKTDFKAVILLPTSGKSYLKEDGNVSIYFDNSLSISKSIAGAKESFTKANIFSQSLEDIIFEHKIQTICVENLHISLPAAFCLHLNMVSQAHKIPLILRIHSFSAKDLQTELVNQLMWDKISCVSRSVAGDCFHKGADIDLLTTDYLGVNKEEFNTKKNLNFNLRKKLGLPENSKIVLTASRVILGKNNILRQKGIINLIQAFSKLSPRFSNLHLVIAVGRPPERLNEEFNSALEMLNGYLKLNHIEEKTTVKLFELEEMGDVYRQSDIFVLASENETFGQVFIEAMACGLPVIGTKVGGIPEIISDSYNGYLVPPDDSSILAQRMEILLNNNTVRRKFINSGVKTVEEKFTSEKQFANFMNILKETSNITIEVNNKISTLVNFNSIL